VDRRCAGEGELDVVSQTIGDVASVTVEGGGDTTRTDDGVGVASCA
jgi:hypothetical protein